ncbi:hypothetical protein [Aliiglaciecola lipolytica]|uniref:hypothetical protein n=1 Tax=Aliiglaciecola lipolytica TaxID=477689 RepID=UPI00058BDEAF|nr:hypothetical protein [Aliiglaciecola lipolytica]
MELLGPPRYVAWDLFHEGIWKFLLATCYGLKPALQVNLMEVLGPPKNVAWDLSHGVVGTSTECSMGFIPWGCLGFLLATG